MNCTRMIASGDGPSATRLRFAALYEPISIRDLKEIPMDPKTAATALVFLTTLMMIAAGGPVNAQNQRDQARDNFARADANRDGHLDPTEFRTFINLNADQGLGRAPTIRRFNAYSNAFAELDKNRDGRLSPQEVAEAANR